EGAVKRMLDRELPPLRVDRAQSEEWHATNVLERCPIIDRLVEARDERHADTQLLALPHPVHEDVIGLRREREDHMASGGALDGLGQLVQPAEDRQRIPAGGVEAPERIVIKEADRA